MMPADVQTRVVESASVGAQAVFAVLALFRL